MAVPLTQVALVSSSRTARRPSLAALTTGACALPMVTKSKGEAGHLRKVLGIILGIYKSLFLCNTLGVMVVVGRRYKDSANV